MDLQILLDPSFVLLSDSALHPAAVSLPRPGAAVIKHWQDGSIVLGDKIFACNQCVVREIAQDMTTTTNGPMHELRWQVSALLALQEATEAFLVCLFEDAPIRRLKAVNAYWRIMLRLL
ncbi:hypothetical protein D9757_010257 [Collybiopsis confluens]|uniref:Uncharacterized protein n=1 Tax=Collybiopsis confluens TaxID=2823264 RepID=A0A8H5HAX5_9AGAR|nr:hypothetical protein D9757_010257 [Collybiopsis confluens]